MPKIICCETMLKPTMVNAPSSTNPHLTYTVIAKTLFNDSVCTCPGFQYRGNCRHVDEMDANVCRYYRSSPAKEENELCPVCSHILVEFTMEPELD